MELRSRKPNRLQGFDYSTPGAYFVTACVKEKHCVLSRICVVGERNALPRASVELTEIGAAVRRSIEAIPVHYPSVAVSQYVIMPNYIHLLIGLEGGGSAMRSPTIPTVMNQMKGAVTKEIGYSIWQRSYHDHILRTRTEYEQIWNYIVTNPETWEQDCFYGTDIKNRFKTEIL